MYEKIKIYEVTLAGLLHDIGKLMQRAGLEKEYPEIINNYSEFCPTPTSYLHGAHTAYFIEKFIPNGLLNKTEIYNGARHHKNPFGDIYKEADIISSGMDRYSDEAEDKGYKDVCMKSIFDLIELQYIIKKQGEKYNLKWNYKITYESKKNIYNLYPVIDKKEFICAGEDIYYNLWKKFSKDIEEIKKITNIKLYFNELYWIIQKYTSFIPSATNVLPDISLFDHLKTTAAIASSLFIHSIDSTEKEEFILYGGDISGIQKYIFKISRSQGIGNIAKRLRGRSFYISMISEILSRYIINKIGITQANINFCGGGNFEILLPNTSKVEKFLKKFERDVNLWLIKNFYGELGFVCGYIKLTKEELKKEYATKKEELSEIIQRKKLKKFYPVMEGNIWQEDKDFHKQICHSCHMNIVKKDTLFCELCLQDKTLGELLTKSNYIVFSDYKLSRESVEFGTFGCVTLLKDKQLSQKIINNASYIYSLKEELSEIKSVYYLSKTIPKALKEMELETEIDEEGNKKVSKDQILSFSTLAHMSLGDKKIGILKMDVDNLGSIFSLGLQANSNIEENYVPKSISRLSSISRLFSLFFTIILDEICEQIFKKWQEDPENKWSHAKDVSNIFYVIFSGGDDLIIVGPWDQIIELAWEIRKSFKKFTCHNPNINISGGIYICKPKYPINHSVAKAEMALEQSKSKGKNRVTVMGETMVWSEESPDSKIYQEHIKNYYKNFTENELKSEKINLKEGSSPIWIDTLTFKELKNFADKLDNYLKKKKLSFNFLRNLINAKKQFFPIYYNTEKEIFEESHNHMFLPFLNYIIERNLDKEIRSEIKSMLITNGEGEKYIRQAIFPCKYVLMKNRK